MSLKRFARYGESRPHLRWARLGNRKRSILTARYGARNPPARGGKLEVFACTLPAPRFALQASTFHTFAIPFGRCRLEVQVAVRNGFVAVLCLGVGIYLLQGSLGRSAARSAHH